MTSFTTPDEQTYYRAAVLKAGLKLLRVGIIPHRGWTKKSAMEAAAKITGVKKYRKIDIDQAIADLDHWLKQRQSGPVLETSVIDVSAIGEPVQVPIQ